MTLRKPKIMVIEDDFSLAELLETIFEQSGYECVIFHHTLDIIPLVDAQQPDLVLLDYLLPEINGGELCGQIKRHPLFSKTPVIIFSAWSKVLLSLGDYGCDLFIEKPFDLHDFRAKVKRLLVKQQLKVHTAIH